MDRTVQRETRMNLNTQGMLLGGGMEDGGGIDQYTLACIRPKLVGGVWVPGDASTYNRSVTNNGITVTPGPWGADNTGLSDPTYAANCYTPGSATLAAGSVRDIDFQLKVTERPASVYKVVFMLGSVGIEYPALCVYYGPGSSGKVHFLLRSRLSVGGYYSYFTGDYDYGNIWRHIRILCPAGTGKFSLYIDGQRKGDTPSHTPTWGATPNLILGVEKTVANWVNNSISGLAEVRVSSIVRWTKNFSPPTAPYILL